MTRGEGQGEGSLRWWILVFTSIALFSNYYVYDSIAPVADLLQRSGTSGLNASTRSTVGNRLSGLK